MYQALEMHTASIITVEMKCVSIQEVYIGVRRNNHARRLAGQSRDEEGKQDCLNLPWPDAGHNAT